MQTNFWVLEQERHEIEREAGDGAQRGHCEKIPQPWFRAMPKARIFLLKTQTQYFLGLPLFKKEKKHEQPQQQKGNKLPFPQLKQKKKIDIIHL